MRISTLLLSALFLSLGLSVAPAQAQGLSNNSGLFASVSSRNNPTTTPPSAASEGTVVLMGKITSPAGALPGAVVIITSTKQMAVTNSQGEFKFVVPASAGALAAVVTYAGYADEPLLLNTGASESTANLANARVIVVARKQQLKYYIKTARKQIKRELRKVH